MTEDPAAAGATDQETDEDSELVALTARREARASIPATYVDTWASQIWKGHLRLVLGEWLSGGPHYRAAFVMELEDAEGLARHILRRAERQRERDAARARKDQTPENES